MSRLFCTFVCGITPRQTHWSNLLFSVIQQECFQSIPGIGGRILSITQNASRSTKCFVSSVTLVKRTSMCYEYDRFNYLWFVDVTRMKYSLKHETFELRGSFRGISFAQRVNVNIFKRNNVIIMFLGSFASHENIRNQYLLKQFI